MGHYLAVDLGAESGRVMLGSLENGRLTLEETILVALKIALVFGLAFPAAQTAATLVALTSNFLLNNILTYRDKRLRGWAMLRGFIAFCAIGAVGALTNVGLASWLYSEREVWWVAGAAGAVMGALWNYAMSTLFVWRAR